MERPSDDAIEAIIQQATSAATSYSRAGGPLRDTRTQLFVGNLPYRVRWQDLKDLFRKAGTVLRADVSLGPDNRSRGYGTVLLATAEDAGRAVDTFNGYSWQSRILEVRLDRQLQEFDSPTPSNNDPDYPPSVSDPNSRRNLFVGNLPFHCQWQDLKDLFRQAGTIMRADVVLGPDGRSRGFGTVVFATELDAERALKMFNGYEFNGRVLNVHRDKYSFSNQSENTSTSPVPGSSSGASSHPTHITLPPGYMFDLLPSSGPTSPHEMFKYQHHQRLHDQQQQSQQQPHLQFQQHQHRPQHQQQHHQQRNRLYDTLDHENLPDTSPFRSGASSTQFHDFLPSSSSSSSRPPSTSAPISTKHPIPIPIYKPPPLGHTNTASSGSDRSDMFSRLSSTSATSASSVSRNPSSVSRPHSQDPDYSHGQVPGQGQRARGQPFQTSSPHPASSPPESPHHSHSGSQHHSSSSSHSSSPHVSQSSSSYTTSACRSLSRPPSSNPNHRPPQRPGPISLPPPLLPSQIAFDLPLQLSPHMHTPLGMSVSVSVSPLVENSGGFGYASGMYGQQQQQQFGQHMIPLQVTTPNGLPMTPSMPPFFLPPTMASGSHATPTGASMRVGTGGGSSSSGGHRHMQSRSKSLARHLEGELGSVCVDDENARSNVNVSVNDRTSSPSVSPPPSSSARQRHHHQQHRHHHQNQQSSQQPSYHQTPPPRRSAGGAGSSSNAQPTPNASNASTIHQLQPMLMHINLNSIPGAFSPGVVMSPGTFYGRPGEAPTFINAAVGAPLTMRGSGADTSEDGSAGVQEQTQQGQGQAGQWYYQNQTHGSYFYAMSSPRRRTPTGMEPKGYFDPLFFPAGVNVCGDGVGYSSSVGESGTLVNEIMKDGRAESLGVEIGKEERRGKGMERKGEGEDETHISDDGDDERDSGDDADVDDDGSYGQVEEGENQEAHDTDPSFDFRG